MWRTHKGTQYFKALMAMTTQAMLSVPSSSGFNILNSRTTKVGNARQIKPDRSTSCSNFFSLLSSKNCYAQPVDFNVHQTLSNRSTLFLPIRGRIECTSSKQKKWNNLFQLPLSLHAKNNLSTKVNLLKTKRNLLYISNQSVPRSKHFPPRL